MGKFAITIMMGFLLLLWAGVTEAVYMKYKDPKQPLNVRIRDLMNRMSLEEKIGQMTQIERHLAAPDIMKKYFIVLYQDEFKWSNMVGEDSYSQPPLAWD